jgi:hypothetical protein
MIETDLFLEYKQYMLEKSIFKDILLIVPNAPKSLAKFPTIVMSEINNSDNSRGKTTDRIEYVSRLSYRVSIFVKPVTINDTKYQDRQVMDELKKLTYDFFNQAGFNRNSSRKTDNYLDLSVLRQEIIFTGNLASWNNSLYF